MLWRFIISRGKVKASRNEVVAYVFLRLALILWITSRTIPYQWYAWNFSYLMCWLETPLAISSLPSVPPLFSKTLVQVIETSNLQASFWLYTSTIYGWTYFIFELFVSSLYRVKLLTFFMFLESSFAFIIHCWSKYPLLVLVIR